MDWERFGIYVFSAFYGYACLTAPYKGRKWVNRLTVFIILLLLMWLPACDDTRTITETEYVDRDVIATEPYYTRTVYDENMGEFTAEQQEELRTKGYITMRLFYTSGPLVLSSNCNSSDEFTNPFRTLNFVISSPGSGGTLSYVSGKIGNCARLYQNTDGYNGKALATSDNVPPVGAISFWAYIDGLGGGIGFDGPHASVYLKKLSGSVRVDAKSPNLFSWSDDTYVVTGGSWHHIYALWNEDSLIVYIDGTLRFNIAVGSGTSVSGFSVYALGNGSTYSDARIDSLKYWTSYVNFSAQEWNNGTGIE